MYVRQAIELRVLLLLLINNFIVVLCINVRYNSAGVRLIHRPPSTPSTPRRRIPHRLRRFFQHPKKPPLLPPLSRHVPAGAGTPHNNRLYHPPRDRQNIGKTSDAGTARYKPRESGPSRLTADACDGRHSGVRTTLSLVPGSSVVPTHASAPLSCCGPELSRSVPASCSTVVAAARHPQRLSTTGVRRVQMKTRDGPTGDQPS